MAALGFALIEGRSAPLSVLRSWLSTWTGIGHVIDRMHRQGYDVQLTQYDERGWRATFYVSGMERDGAFGYELHGFSVGAYPVARGATCRV